VRPGENIWSAKRALAAFALHNATKRSSHSLATRRRISRIMPNDPTKSVDRASDIAVLGLEPHPHRFVLRGHPGSLAFPSLCARCGAAASRKLGYAKALTRSYSSDAPSSHVVTPVEVPFCGVCIQRHEASSRPRSAMANLLASMTHSDSMGAVALSIAAVFTGWVCLKNLSSGNTGPLWVLVPLCLAFALMARSQARSGWANSAHLRVEHGSEVTRAFDYSDTNENTFEAVRFTCTIRDPQFAAAFATLNRERLWIPGSPAVQAEIRASNRRLWKFGIGLVIVLVALQVLSTVSGK
jgi:hypothetical protein